MVSKDLSLRSVQKKKGKKMNNKISKTDDEWKNQLSSEEYSICREKKKHPALSKIIKFVDLNQYGLERFESEKRTEEKRKKNE